VIDSDVTVVDGSVGFDVHAALPMAIVALKRRRRTVDAESGMGTCPVDVAFR